MRLYHHLHQAAVGLHVRCLCAPERRLRAFGTAEYAILAFAVIIIAIAARGILEGAVTQAVQNVADQLAIAVPDSEVEPVATPS